MKFNELLKYLLVEVSNKKKAGSLIGLITNIIKRTRNNSKLRFVFLFRIAQYFNSKGAFCSYLAKKIQDNINIKYSTDININARIGVGLRIAHLPGIVISGYATIGCNFFVRQNTTIGIKTLGLNSYILKIGDNVSIGANSCIIGDHINIGDNVTIGAMSLVNNDVPSNCTFYNLRERKVTFHE